MLVVVINPSAATMKCVRNCYLFVINFVHQLCEREKEGKEEHEEMVIVLVTGIRSE